jgi:putative CocE/NonD family hydrolase
MTIVVEKSIAIPMRDNAVLRGDLYRPAGDGAFPTLIQRTPYNKQFLSLTGLTLDPIRAAAHGYAVLIQDVRARWASEGGVFFMYRNEFDDGADTVRWATTQTWCNGEIGAYGLSYMGAMTWLMAAGAPDNIRAIAPTTAPFDFWDNHLWRGGALNLGLLLSWTLATIGPSARARNTAPVEIPAALSALMDAIDRFDAWSKHAPMNTLPPALPGDSSFVPFFFEILKQNTPNTFTRSLLMNDRHGAVRAPALITAGWHDVLLDGDLAHFAAMKKRGATTEAREKTRLIIGPWAHGMFQHVVGDVDFGFRANGMFLDMREDLTALHLRWFDRWLAGKENGVDQEARVKIFVQGANRWRDESDWPLARAADTPFFLASDGELGGAPPAQAAARSYRYDPSDPCPTAGGPILMPLTYPRGPVDQRTWLQRSDVLAFTSEPIEADMEVTGHVRAILFAATTGKDTDWIVKLCDVHPSGATISVCDGVLRARFRNGFDRAALVEPGAVNEYEIALSATSMVFKRGHRLRVLVTSSDFPRYDRNPNTGEWPSEAVRFEPAQQQIFCGGDRCSRIILPIVKAAG